MQYDIIGDVHGDAEELETLLSMLGYGFKNGYYQQEGHTAIFLGDLIDGGTQNNRVIEIVRNMVEQKSGLATMGNHEYNAICYHTTNPDNPRCFLREHSKKNFNQHAAFLDEFPFGSQCAEDVIQWFKTLPLYIERQDFRVIHACWDLDMIGKLEPYLNEDLTLKDGFYPLSAYKRTELYEIIERLLKGFEIDLDEELKGLWVKDKKGVKRYNARGKWWKHEGETLGQCVFGYASEKLSPGFETKILKDRLSPEYMGYRPVFFGHYHLDIDLKTDQIIFGEKQNICCVDYSPKNQGGLVSYSFMNPSDDSKLHTANFTWSKEAA